MTLARIILTALAALRLTRFVTSDKLGEWWVAGPLVLWAWRSDEPIGHMNSADIARIRSMDPAEAAPPMPNAHWGWRSKLVNGLDCPFCVGFWIGAAVLLAELVTRRVPALRGLWSFIAGALALNYVTGHVSKRIDG